MNSAVHSVPARILKRADVSTGLARPVAPEVAVSNEATERVSAPTVRHVSKEARLVPGPSGTSAVEVRCSCGEWTRIELRLGDGQTVSTGQTGGEPR